MKNIVVGLGEALWDVLPDGRKLGGAPANFAYHAGQFGIDTLAVSALGKDSLGDETCKELEKKGLRHVMPRLDYPTGTVQVTLDKSGVPAYDIKEGVAWDNIPFTPEIEEIAHNCRAVCFGSLAQRSKVRARQYASLSRPPRKLHAHLRYQPASELLYQGSDTGVAQTVQCSEDKR